MGPFAVLSMPSFDFHLPLCTEGFLIHLSPLWQLPLFLSVAQFPCVQAPIFGPLDCSPIPKLKLSTPWNGVSAYV